MRLQSLYYNLTLARYIEFNNIPEEDWHLKVEMLCGKVTIEEAVNYYAQIKMLETSLPSVKPKKYYVIGSKLYKVNYKMSEIRADQFIDLMHFVSKDNPENEINNILAVFLKPFGQNAYNGSTHSEIAKDLLKMKLIDAMPIMVFFCGYLSKLLDNIPIYLTQNLQTATRLLKNGDG